MLIKNRLSNKGSKIDLKVLENNKKILILKKHYWMMSPNDFQFWKVITHSFLIKIKLTKKLPS
jgi:hypothetical protein